MERTGYKILILIFLLVVPPVLNASSRSEIYSAYISNDMYRWKTAIDRMNAIKQKSNELRAELVNYQYGYIAWCIEEKRNDEARKYLKLAEENLEILKTDKKNLSLINSYRSAFYGYKIGLNKLSAPFNGGKSLDCAKEAVRLDAENYLAYVQFGNIEFYMPSAFGGSKKEALEYFLKAEKLIERNKDDLEQNWNYLSLLTIIAQAYSYTDDLQASKNYLDKVLRIEPGFIWVKNELYPQILNKMKKE